jgi:NADH:ubiquinone oxidoreductase subunit F (NADH-binding)
LLRFFADESARQCGTCKFGTIAMADALERIARGESRRDDLQRLSHYANEMLPGRGACGHLDGATIAARTALSVFRDDIQRHITHGRCGRSVTCALPGVGRMFDATH